MSPRNAEKFDIGASLRGYGDDGDQFLPQEPEVVLGDLIEEEEEFGVLDATVSDEVVAAHMPGVLDGIFGVNNWLVRLFAASRRVLLNPVEEDFHLELFDEGPIFHYFTREGSFSWDRLDVTLRRIRLTEAHLPFLTALSHQFVARSANQLLFDYLPFNTVAQLPNLEAYDLMNHMLDQPYLAFVTMPAIVHILVYRWFSLRYALPSSSAHPASLSLIGARTLVVLQNDGTYEEYLSEFTAADYLPVHDGGLTRINMSLNHGDVLQRGNRLQLLLLTSLCVGLGIPPVRDDVGLLNNLANSYVEVVINMPQRIVIRHFLATRSAKFMHPGVICDLLTVVTEGRIYRTPNVEVYRRWANWHQRLPVVDCVYTIPMVACELESAFLF